MEEDEDTLMGEPVSQTTIPIVAGSSGVTQPHLTQGDDASSGRAASLPSLLTLSQRPPLLMRHSSQSAYDSTPAPENAGPVLMKGLTKSIEDEGLHIKSSEESDSLMEENSDWSVDEATTSVGLPLTALATGLCYDIRMRYHCEVRPTADVHPEDPRRIYYIYKELCRAGLIDDPESTKPLAPRPMQRIDVRDATEEEVELVHAPDHFTFVESTRSQFVTSLLDRNLN